MTWIVLGLAVGLGAQALCMLHLLRQVQSAHERVDAWARHASDLECAIAGTDAWIGLEKDGDCPLTERADAPLDEYLDARERELCEWLGLERPVRVDVELETE